MHCLLPTQPPEQKPRWPVHLPELVQAYNNTPHASTGFAPYILLFGQEPRLPVDDLLGRPAHTAAGAVDWCGNTASACRRPTTRHPTS